MNSNVLEVLINLLDAAEIYVLVFEFLQIQNEKLLRVLLIKIVGTI